MLRLIVVVASGVLVAGCNASPDYWVMDGVKGAERSRLVAIHDGYCTMVANNALQGRSMPFVPSTGGGTTFVDGTYNGRPFSGTVTSYPSVGDSIAGGYALGSAIRETIDRNEDRRKIHTACMMANGWRAKTDKDV